MRGWRVVWCLPGVLPIGSALAPNVARAGDWGEAWGSLVWESAPLAVPGLSPWGGIGLALALCAFGTLFVRRAGRLPRLFVPGRDIGSLRGHVLLRTSS